MIPQQFSIFRWFRTHLFLSGVIGLATVLVVEAIDTPESNNLRETPERAIQMARIFSSYIVDGDVESLIHFTDQEETAERLRRSPPPSFRNILWSEVEATKLLPRSHSSLAPIDATFSPPESRMQIIRLERRDSFFVMSFVALSGPQFTNEYIEADGHPLVVTVAVRYIVKPPKTPFGRWRNRLANIDWLPDTIHEMVSGDWYLIDYRYSFNLREYYEWVRKNERRLYNQWEQDMKNTPAVIGSKDWLNGLGNRASEEVKSSYLWSYSTSERQLAEALDQLSQQSKSNTIPENKLNNSFNRPSPIVE